MSVATASALTIEDTHHQRQILNNFDVKHCEKFGAHHTAELNKSDNRTMHLHQLSSDDITTTTNTTTINSKQIAGGGAPPSSPPASQLHHLQHQPTAIDSPSFNQHYRLLEEEIESLKAERTRLTQQCSDAQRREKILMRRLANKEQEFQDYVSQIAEYKSAQAPGASAIRSSLLDPAVNLLFEKLKKELQATKAKLEETQNELAAWKFTPDSNTGKRLMAKCRLLYQENEELGKMTSNGRLAKLETELAMQKSFSEEVKKSQSELDDFLQELDEDVEGMQSTILFLQQELKTTRDRIQLLEKENYHLKNENLDDDDSQSVCVSHSIINGIKVSTDSETKIIADAALNVANNSSVAVHSLDNTTQHALLLNDEQTKSNKFHTNHSNYQSSIVVVAEVLESIDDKSNLRTTTANCVPGRTIGEKGDLSDLVNGGCGKNRNDTTGIIAIGGGGANIDESNNSSSVDNGGNGGGSNNKLRLNTNSRKRHYESDSDSDSGSASITLKNSRSLGGLNATKKGKKKLAIRRSSSIVDTAKDMGDVSGICSVNDEVGGGEVAEELDVATEQKSDHDADDDGITSGLSALTSGTNMLTAAITGAGNTRVLGRKKSLRNHQNGGENNL